MSELLPTLRESLRETAERRHRRRRRPLVPALTAVAAVAAALILMAQRDGTQPADEVPATPTATFTPTFAPSPAATPRVMPGLDPKDLHATPVARDDSSLKEALSLLDESHQVVRAWKVRGLEGHVLLTLNTIRSGSNNARLRPGTSRPASARCPAPAALAGTQRARLTHTAAGTAPWAVRGLR